MPRTNDPARSARREIAEYLRRQSGPLQRANEAQRQWAAVLPDLYGQSAEGAGAAATAARARALGRLYGPRFRESLDQVETLNVPLPAIRCQEYMGRWLKALINAADSLANAPEDGRDLAYLRDCADFLEDARYAVKPLTEVRQLLYEAVRGPPRR